jgi:hypothetical protein
MGTIEEIPNPVSGTITDIIAVTHEQSDTSFQVEIRLKGYGVSFFLFAGDKKYLDCLPWLFRQAWAPSVVTFRWVILPNEDYHITEILECPTK